MQNEHCKALLSSDNLNASEWEQVVFPKWIYGNPVVLPSVNSTNDYALDLAKNHHAPEGTLVIADSQIAGRGKQRRKWHSPLGVSIYASVVLRPNFSPQYVHLPTLLASAAAAVIVQHLYRLPARVKWPNDIYLNGKKLGGVLTESMISGHSIEYLVLGIGLNCNNSIEDWNPELRSIATSLYQESGLKVNRAELLAGILRIFGMDYDLCRHGDIQAAMSAWRNLNMSLGAPVTIRTSEGIVEGIAEDLLPSGALRIRDSQSNQCRDIRIGEVC